jgi:hypothetical protein
MALNDTLVYRLRSSARSMPEAEIDGGELLTEAANRIEWLEKECMYLHRRHGDLVIQRDKALAGSPASGGTEHE